MNTRKIIVFLIVSCLAASPCLGLSGVPDLEMSTATLAGGAGQVLTLMVVPDGSGPGFGDARDPQGNPVDATVELVLNDGAGASIMNYPFEDLWLEVDASTPGFISCPPRLPGSPPSQIISDASTDVLGRTFWAQPPQGGGYSEGPVFVAVNGARLYSNPGLALRFNSPDINGDMRVNLSDVTEFAQDFYGAYNFRSDLEHDGIINLSDVTRFAQHLGADCP